MNDMDERSEDNNNHVEKDEQVILVEEELEEHDEEVVDANKLEEGQHKEVVGAHKQEGVHDEQEVDAHKQEEGNDEDVVNAHKHQEGHDEQVVDAHRQEGLLEDEMNEFQPRIGMEFQSQEEAYDFYNRYAGKMGFSVRKHSTCKSHRNKDVIGRTYCCSLQGLRDPRSKPFDQRKRNQADVRTACKAMVTIRKQKGVKWVMTRFVEEHNHKLVSPSERHKLRSLRRISKGQEQVLENLHLTGLDTIPMMNHKVINQDEETVASCHDSITFRYNKLFQEAVNIAAKGSTSVEVYSVAMQGLHRTLREVENALKSLSVNPVELPEGTQSRHIKVLSKGSSGNHADNPKLLVDKLSKKKLSTNSGTHKHAGDSVSLQTSVTLSNEMFQDTQRKVDKTVQGMHASEVTSGHQPKRLMQLTYSIRYVLVAYV